MDTLSLHLRYLAHYFAIFALASSLMAASAYSCTGKKLYVFTGPHRSAATSVEEFFYKYARGTQPNHAHGKTFHALADFRWPLVEGDESDKREQSRPYKRFNHLLTEPNNKKLRTEIINSIKNDWKKPDVSAVIMGGEEFDQIGPLVANNSDYDAIDAIRDIASALDLHSSPDCVTVIVNYRVPRFEHWLSVYHDLTVDPYEEHMCAREGGEESTITELRIRELGTTMNPMYLSKMYLNEGWNVKLIDMGGVSKDGTDISHTIGCDILGGRCTKENWVKGHEYESITNNVIEREFHSLPEEEIELSEQLFKYRDCAYEQELRNNTAFSVVLNDTVWDDCDHHRLGHIYQSLRNPEDTHFIFEALLSQVDCPGKKNHQGTVTMDDVLNGKHIAVVTSSSFSSSSSPSSLWALTLLVLLIFGGLGCACTRHAQAHGTIVNNAKHMQRGGGRTSSYPESSSSAKKFRDNPSNKNCNKKKSTDEDHQGGEISKASSSFQGQHQEENHLGAKDKGILAGFLRFRSKPNKSSEAEMVKTECNDVIPNELYQDEPYNCEDDGEEADII